MKTQKEINTENLVSAQLRDLEIMRVHNAMNSWILLTKEKDRKNIHLAEKARFKSFREEKMVDFIFFAVLIMITSFLVLSCGAAVWKADYASAVLVSPFATIVFFLAVLFYKKVVVTPFEPLIIPNVS
jgi:fatty acid desaturase